MKQTRLNRNNNSTTKDNDSRILRSNSLLEGIDFDSSFSEDNTISSKTDTSDIELDREEDDDEVVFENLKEENKGVIDMSDFSDDDDSAILAAAARLTEKRDASSPMTSKSKSIKLQPSRSPQQESKEFKHPITKPIQSSKTSRGGGLFNYFPSNAFGTALQQIRFHSKSSKQTSSYSTAAPNEHFDYDHHQPRFYEMTQRPGRDSLDTIEPIRHVGSANKIKEVHTFSKKQEEVLQKVKRGVSLFFTGSAGTGKSVLLKKMISELRKIYPDQVAVTASTGLAACNIGGQTLHSFAGIGLGTGDKESLVKKVRSSRKASARWKAIRVLIVDEISMVDGHLLDKLNHVAKKIRKSNLPFGGIQVVLSGDFYQLPPVVKQVDNRGEEILEKLEPYFAFESAAWEEIIQDIVVLDEVFRQKGDQGFIDMLNEMRDGIVSESAIKKFRVLERPLPNHDGITAAELYATRFEVERANKRRLDQLPGMEVTYPAFDSGTLPEPQRSNLLQNFLAPWDLHLKKDAQVMCIKNFDETLVNGSLGKIVNFVDRETYLSTGNTNPDDKSKTVYNAPVESEDKEQPDLSDYIFHGMVDC
ncbi:uncharacterized protein J8A68_001874 [[Candida] subhashii]|uniref:ATP-dependent DNA helicase n=1 Tax=[Candida] subhashii TaxID=561895 RepID=A0A8J5V2T8_9ASCO|nr:uncharacterized protein J8A68_001874 [[Candida] subhashii]KAG7664579.1 hypothetical protein J8A68_001874 [[Candida] subhashii]